LGTNNGLALYRPETDDFIAFRHNQKNPFSLVSDIIYDIREMHDGTLWIASDIGGVNILDLSQISFQSPDDVKFRSIDVTYDKYGLSSGNIRSLLEDDYGNVWIGNRSS
jgi:ligand-binding sensor domain-containing protein